MSNVKKLTEGGEGGGGEGGGNRKFSNYNTLSF